jgi:hypothetical protein
MIKNNRTQLNSSHSEAIIEESPFKHTEIGLILEDCEVLSV